MLKTNAYFTLPHSAATLGCSIACSSALVQLPRGLGGPLVEALAGCTCRASNGLGMDEYDWSFWRLAPPVGWHQGSQADVTAFSLLYFASQCGPQGSSFIF